MSNPEHRRIFVLGSMFAWFNESGYQADIAALRQLYLPLKTLEVWLKDSNAFPLPV